MNIKNFFIIFLILQAKSYIVSAQMQIQMKPREGILSIDDMEFSELLSSDTKLSIIHVKTLADIRRNALSWYNNATRITTQDLIVDIEALYKENPESSTITGVLAEIYILHGHGGKSGGASPAVIENLLTLAYERGSINSGILLGMRRISIPLTEDTKSLHIEGINILNSILVNHKNIHAKFLLSVYFISNSEAFDNVSFKDDNRFIQLLKEAANGGHELAKEYLLIFEIRGQIKSARQFQEIFSEIEYLALKGYSTSSLFAGRYYSTGYGVTKDISKGIAYLENAVKYHGSLEAAMLLSNIFLTSESQTDGIHSYEKAYFWTTVAKHLQDSLNIPVKAIDYSRANFSIVKRKLTYDSMRIQGEKALAFIEQLPYSAR